MDKIFFLLILMPICAFATTKSSQEIEYFAIHQFDNLFLELEAIPDDDVITKSRLRGMIAAYFDVLSYLGSN